MNDDDPLLLLGVGVVALAVIAALLTTAIILLGFSL